MADTTEEEHLEGFHTTDTEFVYEHEVGLTIHAHRATPWLSWDETKALAAWLNQMIRTARSGAARAKRRGAAMTDATEPTELPAIAKAVTQAIYDELEGPIADCDFGRQKRQWELAVRLAKVAMVKLAEIAAAKAP